MHNSHQFRKMCLDPEVYKNPEEFRPERFMGPTPEEDPSTTAVFGFGRRYVGFFSPMPRLINVRLANRICPGRLLADASLFITIAMCLSAFDIKPVVENGRPVLPEYKPEGGPVKYVLLFPFESAYQPRLQSTGTLQVPDIAEVR